MDWLIGAASVVMVCALVGLLLFVLMHLMAASRQTIQTLPRDEVFARERNRGESQ